MRGCSRAGLFLVCFSSVLAACEPETPGPFDPRGAEVALYGEWDVNGEDPAMGEACAEAGLETVELAFFEPGAPEPFVDARFRFPCEHGMYESGVAVLRTGSFEYAFRAYETGASEPLLTSSRYPYVMERSGEFILRAVDFIRAGAR